MPIKPSQSRLTSHDSPSKAIITVARINDDAAPPVRPAVEAINPCSAVRPCGANQTREARVNAG